MNNYLKCPICGSRFVTSCLTSNPPKFEGECSHYCGFKLRYYDRENSFVPISQEELNERKIYERN